MYPDGKTPEQESDDSAVMFGLAMLAIAFITVIVTTALVLLLLFG